MLKRRKGAMSSPSSSRMMAGSEIPGGSSLMSSQLHTGGGNKPIFLLFQLFTSSQGSVFPSSVLCSTLPRTNRLELNLIRAFLRLAGSLCAISFPSLSRGSGFNHAEEGST